jgi:hypothetical protein
MYGTSTKVPGSGSQTGGVDKAIWDGGEVFLA